MYPEVEEYFRRVENPRRKEQSARRKADFEYREAEHALRYKAEDEGRQYDTRGQDREADRALRRARDAAYTAARQAREAEEQGMDEVRALLTNSEHKEVKWIAEEILFNVNSDEVKDHARTILRALPATREELWELAKNDHGMCNVFDDYFNKAEAAGVLPGGDALLWRETHALRQYISRNYGASYSRDIMGRVKSMVAKVREEEQRLAAEAMRAAKEEWQRLDEARDENTHRNRSAGARRAAETRRRNAEQAQAVVDTTREELAADAAETADPFEDVAPVLKPPTTMAAVSDNFITVVV